MQPGPPLVHLEVSATDGPSYELRVEASGLVIFDGKQGVSGLGRHWRRALPETVDGLLHRLCAVRLDRLRPPLAPGRPTGTLRLVGCPSPVWLQYDTLATDASSELAQSAVDDVLDVTHARPLSRAARYR
ncbi:MAG: hypothetical protein ACXWLG_05960 [Myxococcaceae bacterium]